MCLAQEHNTVAPVRLDLQPLGHNPEKHSAIEPMRSLSGPADLKSGNVVYQMEGDEE